MTKRSEDVWYAVGDEVRTYRGTLLTVNEWLTDEEAEYVARVAAAAPQMLKALELFVEEYVELVNSGDAGFWNPEDEDKVKFARAAISKAKGESK